MHQLIKEAAEPVVGLEFIQVKKYLGTVSNVNNVNHVNHVNHVNICQYNANSVWVWS